jgi:hypothetical protein
MINILRPTNLKIIEGIMRSSYVKILIEIEFLINVLSDKIRYLAYNIGNMANKS